VSIIYVMIPLALLLLGVALWALIWAIRSGQLDDLESQGWTVVLDDDQQPVQDGAEAEPPAVAEEAGERQQQPDKPGDKA
jgi:cbb3-type cytochrome oxidase maturation protein